jgi:hypothetical protein
VSRPRIAATVLCLLIPFGISACGTGKPAPIWHAAPASGSASPTTPAVPAPKPPPKTESEVRERVARAAMDLSTFHPDTAKPQTDEAVMFKLAHPCGANGLPSDRRRTGGYERRWSGGDIEIRHYTVGYLEVPGKKLLAELRDVIGRCTTYKDTDGRTATILGPKPPAVPGTDDGFMWCESLQGRSTVYWCTAMLARGQFVTEVNTSHSVLDEASGMLDRLVPIATRALIEAV